MQNKKNIAVFASGSGTNFINIYNNIKNGKVVVLISNNVNSGAVKFAKEKSVNFSIINSTVYSDVNDLNKQYEFILKSHKVELILLAGFIKKVPLNMVASAAVQLGLKISIFKYGAFTCGLNLSFYKFLASRCHQN